jgi:2-dehydropantoate 2-reductase
MRILVVGAGAVGGYFGGRLAQAGKDVTFLVRAPHAESLRTQGLHITSPHGDAVITPKIVLADEIAGSYDLLLLSVKAYSLETAMNDFAPAVGAGTIVLPLLNGMRHLDLLAGRFSEDKVMGGVCLIAADVAQNGHILHLSEIHRLVYGERNGETSPRMKSLDEVMSGALFEARTSAHILQEMWEKWVMLASLGAATCLLRGNIGEIETVPGGANLARAILAEACEISRGSGYPPGESFLARTEKMLTTQGSSLTSSMYRDMVGNRRVEVEQILGDLVERADGLSLAIPLLRAACANLRVFDARRSRSKA